jgi:hypothetical protein
MGRYCKTPGNELNHECRCVNNNQDPPLPAGTDPQIKALIDGMPQCTKICSGVDPGIYRNSGLQQCSGNFNLQVTNCNQNTSIQGSENIMTGTNIKLDCKPQQSNTTNVTAPTGETKSYEREYSAPTGGNVPSTPVSLPEDPDQKNMMYLLLLVFIIFIVVVVYFFVLDKDPKPTPKNEK